MLFLFSFKGELAALSAAFLWAIATLIFGRLGKQLSPLVLNFVKGQIAIAFILLTLTLQRNWPPELNASGAGLLALSGAIGIGLGDTAYFAALNRLGPRRALLMESLAPPLAALLASLFLQEQLTLRAWGGIGLTLIGVSWVITERVPDLYRPLAHPWRGVLFGVLAALGQATGAALSRAALADTAVSPLWSALLRLSAGGAILLLLLRVQPQSQNNFRPLRSSRLLGLIAIAAFLGTYMAIWLQQTALKYSPAGIAQVLSATSPLFILPISVGMGDPVSRRAVLGVICALSGVWLLFIQR